MRLVLLALATVFCAGAAFAQDMPCRNRDGSSKATRAFVEAFNAATQALQARDWSGAMRQAALARAHVRDGVQSSALTQIEIAALAETGDEGTFAAALDAALGTPCLPDAVRDNYRRMLAEIISNPTAPQQR
jgi:hypothetical protein